MATDVIVRSLVTGSWIGWIGRVCYSDGDQSGQYEELF